MFTIVCILIAVPVTVYIGAVTCFPDSKLVKTVQGWANV